jgi:uncharacterized protein HemX
VTSAWLLALRRAPETPGRFRRQRLGVARTERAVPSRAPDLDRYTRGARSMADLDRAARDGHLRPAPEYPLGMKRTSLAALGIGALALATALGVARVSDAQPKASSLEQRITQLEGQNKAQQDQITSLNQADKAEKAEMNAKNAHQATQIAALIDQNKAQQNLIQSLAHQGSARDQRIHAIEVKVGLAK